MSLKVFRSARMISLLTLGSRVLGLVRDMACSWAFGAGSVWSAFTVAFQVPNLFRRLFGEGALSAATVPLMTARYTREGLSAVDDLSGKLVGVLTIVLTAICIASELVVAVLAFAYRHSPDTLLIMGLTAVTLPFMVLICLTGILGGIQNVLGRFGPLAASSIILNLFMITGALAGGLFQPRHGVYALAISVIISGVVQVAWMISGLRKSGLRLQFRADWYDPDIRRIAVTMLPMIAGLGAIQLSALTDSLIAWWFVPGGAGPAILSYAQRLYQFPLGVFAIALATAIFPALSKHAAENDYPGLGATLSRGICVASFEALPCLVGLILVREPLVRLLFERGRFAETPDAVQRVAFALLMYALGIWAFGINQLIVRAYYATGDVKTPLKVAVANLALNLCLNLILVHTVLREAGLALSSSITATLQNVLLVWIFSKRVGHLHWGEMTASIVRIIAATAAMALAVIGLDMAGAGGLRVSLRLALLIPAGGVAYVLVAWLAGSPEINEMLGERFSRRRASRPAG